MSLKLAHLAAKVEATDDFHVARLLVLLKAASGRGDKPIAGIMKLAKMDFLLRYPNCLVRVLRDRGRDRDAESIPEVERNTVETRMVRFRYGPWDSRYRRWIGLLQAKGLAEAYVTGRTVNIRLTDKGKDVADQLVGRDEFAPLFQRGRLVASSVGDMGATALKDYIYKLFPELLDMRWGESINNL